jgi:hypothetical protein
MWCALRARDLQSWGSATLDPSGLPGIGNVIFDETYATTPLEHRFTNLGDVPFRLIAVLNRGPGQTTSGMASLGAAGPSESEGRWFRSTHHPLANQDAWEWEGLDRPVVMVQVSPGKVAVKPESASTLDLQAPGDFVVLQTGAGARVRNVGTGAVTLATVEVR